MTKAQAINSAVNWWVNKLNSRQRHSNGDSSTANVLACLLADVGADEITDDKLEIFAAELRHNINKWMDEYFDGRAMWLSCDYAPCTILSEAAEKAGINTLNFPFKTYMVIEKDGVDFDVKVADGYAKPYISIKEANNA